MSRESGTSGGPETAASAPPLGPIVSDNNEILWNAIVLLNDGVYKIWGFYVTWYTWFFGSNLIVLSWIFVNQQSPSFSENKESVCAIWIIMNLLGTTTSIMLAVHSHRINGRIRDLLKLGGTDVPIAANDILPNDMTTWGGAANALALMIMAALWGALYLA